MTTGENLTISLTTDSEITALCARMMTASDPWITLGINHDQCLAAFEGIGKEIYVMKIGGEIAGFVILQLTGTFKGYIQTVCIRDIYRGKGLGRNLMMFCEERIFKISPNIFICVSSFNKGAIKLYSELGFRLVGELADFVKDGFTELLLRKTIGPMADFPDPSRLRHPGVH